MSSSSSSSSSSSPGSSGGGGGVAATHTALTNPGIVDRLEIDVADYLFPFGFRLERRRPPSSGSGSGGSGGTVVAVLTTPPLPSGSPPIGTLLLDVDDESLLPTIGPLLRTYLRLSPPQISPVRLRAVVRCDFAVDPLAKYDRMNAEQRTVGLARQDDVAAGRMAHRVHMLVRNSMGAALCLDVAIVLPRCRYRRRRTPADGDDDGDGVDVAVVAEEEAPLRVDAVADAMRDNPDVCYPTIRLIERTATEEDGEEEEARDGDGRCGVGGVACCGSAALLRLDVTTRMCTVRHQPRLFRWVSSLPPRRPTTDIVGDGRRVESVDIDGRRRSSPGSNNPEATTFEATYEAMPLVVACIEKVANLHRILMLCRDYDEVRARARGGAGEDDGEEGEPCGTSSLLTNVVVVLPDADADDEGHDKTLREFEDAVDRFHEATDRPEERGGTHDERRCRPTFVREGRAAEAVSTAAVRRRRRDSAARSSPSPSSSSRPYSLVGIDLHPDALALHGDYAARDATASPALRRMRDADAVVFGYESAGVPDGIASELNGWVQIPSRSSINVVAAVSIVLDALLGAGAGFDAG